MARSRRFTQSIVLGYSTQALVMFVGLGLTPFLLHKIGSTQYGLWIIAQQLLVYLALMDFGTAALLPRDTAFSVGRAGSYQNAADLPGLIARTSRLVLLQTPVIALVGTLLWWKMPHSWAPLREPLGLIVLAFSATFPFRIFRALLDGLQDLAFIGWAYLATWSAGTLFTVILAASGFGLNSLAAGWAASQVLNSLVCFIRLRARFRPILPANWLAVGGGESTLQQLSRGLWVSVSQVAQVLIAGTDALVIGRIFGPAAIVPYNCTGKLITVLANQPQLLTQAAGPGLSEMRTSQPRERLAAVTGALSLAMLLVSGLVVTVTLAVNASFVRWWVGTERYSGLLLTVGFALSIVMRHLNVTAIYTLFAFGHERRLAITSLIDGVLSTTLSIVFAISLHSVIGVVGGSLASSLLVFCFGNGRALAAELDLSLLDLIRPLTPWLWRMLVAGTAASTASLVLAPSTFPAISALAAATAALYTLLMFPVAMQSSLQVYLEPYFRRAPLLAAAARLAG